MSHLLRTALYFASIIAVVAALPGCDSSSSTDQKGSMYNRDANTNMTPGGTGMGSGSMNSGTRGDGMNGGGTDTSR